MEKNKGSIIPDIVKKYKNDLLAEWVKEQLADPAWRGDLISEADLKDESAEFVDNFTEVVQTADLTSITSPQWTTALEMLDHISLSWTDRGFNSSQIASFILSFKRPLFKRIRQELRQDSEAQEKEIWLATNLLDTLGIYTTEVLLKNSAEVIRRQREEIYELSTPVFKVAENILPMTLIGTLHSPRTQTVMESLLNKIAETEATIAILDITGVPTVDTLVAQHLLKTVAAARLMGAECIICGIRPQIAQTIATLGVNFDVITKASAAQAMIAALEMMGASITMSKGRP